MSKETETPRSPKTQPTFSDLVGGSPSSLPRKSDGDKPEVKDKDVKATPEPDKKTDKPDESHTDDDKPKDAADGKDTKVPDYEKQYKDTRDAFTKERKARKDLEREMQKQKREMEILKQKLEGTYEEPDSPSLEQATALAQLQTRVQLSEELAIEKLTEELGDAEAAKEKVNELVWDADSIYQKLEASDPGIRARVMGHKFPVLEAMKVVDEYQMLQEYGGSVAEMKKKLEAKIRKEIEDDLKKKVNEDSDPDEVSRLRKASGSGDDRDSKKKPVGLKQLKRELFPMFRSE